MPDVALRTSIISGFPGETEDDFKALMDFVQAAQFDHLGVFLYSNEEGSGSFDIAGQVPARLAKRRQRELLRAQRAISRQKLRSKIGKSLPVLVEGRSEETDLLFRGRLECQAPEIDGRVLINDVFGPEPRLGEFRWATITAASDYDLVARLEAATFGELPIHGKRPGYEPRRAAEARVDGSSIDESRLVNIQPARSEPAFISSR
jgi:ribosomal protein S12 methylthiotransferase